MILLPELELTGFGGNGIRIISMAANLKSDPETINRLHLIKYLSVAMLFCYSVSMQIFIINLGLVLFSQNAFSQIVRPMPTAVPSTVPTTGPIVLPVDAPTDPSNAKMMWCRGPFQYRAGASSHVYIKKSALPAGQQGKHLAPSTCAWVEAPMSASVPVDFLATYYGNDELGRPMEQYVATHQAAIFSGLVPALTSSNVIFGISIYNYQNAFIRSPTYDSPYFIPISH